MTAQRSVASQVSSSREQVFDLFRRWGYLEARLDPLGYFQPLRYPELNLDNEFAAEARAIYCGAVGAEFMHIPDLDRRRWLQERLEADSQPVEQQSILERLVRADIFEQVLQTRYLGTKRYSLEGTTALIPLLDAALNEAAGRDAEQAVLAMSHRGRLNVLVHIVNRDASEIFTGFEDVDPRSVLGGGDVKYHLGATGQYRTASGKKLNIHLVSNPSHLEAVDPVALGRARAKQERLGPDGKKKVLPIVMHGDAAFAGQGIWAETLNFSGVKGFNVGGALHVIVNNLIGFTTVPSELHTARFSADLAKRQPIPILHVNGEDPDAVARVARLAVEYRYQFGSDVVIDLVGYRRHGHSEVDDPTITQPLLYKRINQHPPLYELYAKQISAEVAPVVERVRGELDVAQKKAKASEKMPLLRTLPDYWSQYSGGPYKPSYEVDTGLNEDEIVELGKALTRYPQDFHIHPKLKKLLEQRLEMATGKRPMDYGMAEALAFGSLVLEDVHIRLSGQDSRRGTFNQRHSVLLDIEDEREYVPLCHIEKDQPRVEIYNSILSEAAVLGFEYGFSRDYPDSLVMWEAQFGDFANGAQVIIDQFITAGEDKWGLLSGLVLLLPHGYEGQGPEHSSARMERFLHLCARDNMQVCQPSTAAQYFHLLRRQALRSWRKPLVCFTPKSMLRHPEASSPAEELQRKRFLNIVPDSERDHAQRLLLCTGKIGHELRIESRKRKDDKTAIVFVDQLYPFPEQELVAEIERLQPEEVVWVQEEPANMGALWYMLPRLRRIAHQRPVRSIKRSASASPATGSHKAHEMEQNALISLAFS